MGQFHRYVTNYQGVSIKPYVASHDSTAVDFRRAKPLLKRRSTNLGQERKAEAEEILGHLPWRGWLFSPMELERVMTGGFHSHGGTPKNGWFLLGKILPRNG